MALLGRQVDFSDGRIIPCRQPILSLCQASIPAIHLSVMSYRIRSAKQGKDFIPAENRTFSRTGRGAFPHIYGHIRVFLLNRVLYDSFPAYLRQAERQRR